MQDASFHKYAVIVAGGSGSRMRSSIPKQFLLMGDEPVLMHTVRRFHAYDTAMALVVVLPQEEISTWQSLCEQYQFKVPHAVVSGGATRFQSVKRGLETLDYAEDGVVAVHDGVRPFVDNAMLQEAYETAYAKGSAVVTVALKDSIRRVRAGSSKSVDRGAYRLVQTPQCFRLPLLRKAYAQAEIPLFTDDASVVEKFGHKISLVEGNYRNIKLTTPEDMLLAEAFLASERTNG